MRALAFCGVLSCLFQARSLGQLALDRLPAFVLLPEDDGGGANGALAPKHGFAFGNRSLAAEHPQDRVYCTSASRTVRNTSSSERVFDYTANRLRHHPGSGDKARGLLVLLSSDLKRMADRFDEQLPWNPFNRWECWVENVFPTMGHSLSVAFLVDRNTVTPDDLALFAQRLHLEPLQCAVQAHHHHGSPEAMPSCNAGDSPPQLMDEDSAYTAYLAPLPRNATAAAAGGGVAGARTVVFVASTHLVQHMYWARQGVPESELMQRPELEKYGGFYNYVRTINYYGYPLLKSVRLLDFFDYYVKIDDDITWEKPLPSNFLADLEENRWVAMHTADFTEPEDCVGGLSDAIEFYLDLQVQAVRCGGVMTPAAAGRDWFEKRERTWYTNVVAVWLGLFSSPELLQYAQHMYLYRQGMWTYRWGDQQFFPFALGLFEDESSILDNTWLRRSGVFRHKNDGFPLSCLGEAAK